MQDNTKVRPTFTITEMSLLARGVGEILAKHIQAGDFNNPVLLQLAKLKEYCESYKPKANENSANALLAKYMQQYAGTQTSEPVAASQLVESEQSILINANEMSVLDNPALTDEQRYDILCLKDESLYSDNEKAFFLNTGTMIKIHRQMGKPVSTGDL